MPTGTVTFLCGFVIIAMGSTWLHTSQSVFYRMTAEMTKGEMLTEHDGTVIGVAMTLITFAAIAVSVPYWRALGLISP